MITPARIFRKIIGGKLSLSKGVDLLIAFIETNKNLNIRLSSLRYLRLLDVKPNSLYSLLENLLVSDDQEKIRSLAAEFIGSKFIERAMKPISWALKYEKNYFCYISLIKILSQRSETWIKVLLSSQMDSICSRKYVDAQNLYSNISFINSLDDEKESNWELYSISELAAILINYRTISYLIDKFYYVFFEWKRGLISKLDLSELGWNVSRAWNFIYAERLLDLKEIPELFNLKHLEMLDLSNNRLRSINGLHKLPKITHLYLRNNKLEGLESIRDIKKMNKLEYLDIRGNNIVDDINKKDFPNLNLILKNYLVFM
ncbi:MAG: hypothetical protein GF311_23535 [Candidatus Lokiarchaeota archaeon]|nr:hypothetical protein [Candidatus Lokiarchaeota archaeon]